MFVVGAIVDGQNSFVVEVELRRDLLRPVGDKIVLGHVGLTEHCVLLLEAEGHVVIHLAFFALGAPVKEVGHDLGDLPGVYMVVKREGADLEADSLHTSDTVADICLEEILHLRIGHHGVVAEQVDEDLNFDIELVTSLDPAWVRSIDRNAI